MNQILQIAITSRCHCLISLVTNLLEISQKNLSTPVISYNFAISMSKLYQEVFGLLFMQN